MDETEMTAFTRAKQKMYKYMLDQMKEDDSSKMQDMNLQVYEEELRQLRSKGLVDFLFVVVAVLSGAAAMTRIEGWKFDAAFYWACVTVTTTGYGDVTPGTSAGKAFTIIYIVIACALAAKGFGDMVRYPLVMRAKKNELRIAQQFGSELSEKTLRGILHSDFFDRIPSLRKDKKQLVKSEFVLLMLQIMGKVQDKDIMLACQIFDRLDVAADGVLDEEDQKEQIKRARARDAERAAEQARREAEQEAQHPHHKLSDIGTNIASLGTMLGSALRDTVSSTTERARRFSTASNDVPTSRRKSKRIAEHDDRAHLLRLDEDDAAGADEELGQHSSRSARYTKTAPKRSSSRPRGASHLSTTSSASVESAAPAERSTAAPAVAVDFDDVEAATSDFYASASESPLRRPTTNPMLLSQHQHQHDEQQRQFLRQAAVLPGSVAGATSSPASSLAASKRVALKPPPATKPPAAPPADDFDDDDDAY